MAATAPTSEAWPEREGSRGAAERLTCARRQRARGGAGGHRGWTDDTQGYGWNSLDLGPTVFRVAVRVGGTSGPGSSGNPATSCQALHAAAPQLGNGVYWLDPDGAGPTNPFTAFCDMSTDGG